MRWTQDLANRVRDVHVSSFAIRHTFQKEVSEKTKVFLSSRIASGSARSDAQGLGGGNILGTVRHQYSPRLDFEATAALLRSHLLSLKGIYHDDENAVVVETVLSPRMLPPPLTVTYSRRLFSDAPTEGVLVLHTGGQPYLSASIVAPHAFNLTAESPSGPAASSAGSASGLGVGMRQSTYGINLVGIGSSLRADWGVVFSELAVQAKFGVSLSLAGFSWLLSGAWGDEQGGVTTTVALNTSGVELKLDMTYLGQRLVVPISLSDDYDALLGLVTATVPTAAFVLAYQFILGPRRQKHRAAFFRAARREFVEERTSVRREVEESVALLRDTARKHTQAEKAKEGKLGFIAIHVSIRPVTGTWTGLVIMEATYGPMAPDPELRDLMVDVTIPLQALVHKSQLYIPGHRTKVRVS
ncbi:hypothetical protein EWM64_g8339 [Hericium alpestre]|uniref:Uncharacterized protein n=1 Tax=Hericium alpestre TaxID=135208 RepID=A0A4Y9ZNV2_9AGAM|nr:hypothetical protein EWM64_g8339 [Hericium alpestre]